jgi:NSS family neurotransmitter:Na+ symporter
MSERAVWKSKTGFLLAALGSAIGLGNIWRFPYMAYRNGGGAFLVPYFVALFVVGIPLLMLEFGLGHYFRRAFPQALAKINPRFSWIGWWSVSFVMFGIVAYYGVVIAWCGNYLVYSVTQPWGDVDGVNQFFDESFLGAFVDGQPFSFYDESAGLYAGLRLGAMQWHVFVSLALVWGVNWIITRRHLQQGIELANKIFIPALIVLTLILVAWSWNFQGAADGRYVYLTPDWQQVYQPQTWIDAFSQIFFTLSIGFGIMVAYASYLPAKADIPTSAFLAAVGNCIFSIVAAFAVFAAIGMLAEHREVDLRGMLAVERQVESLQALQQTDPAAFATQAVLYAELSEQHEQNQRFQSQMSTFGLIFTTYPAILTKMGPIAGGAFGVMFFLTLLIAGILSSISIVEAFMASLHDQFGWGREGTSAVLCLIGFLLGMVFCTQAGLFLLDLVDHFITTYALVLVAIGEALIVGWVLPAKKLCSHLDEHRDFRLRGTFAMFSRILITAMLMLTWIGLAGMETAPISGGLARIALLASVVILWIDQHWLDFDIRLVIPVLLLVLLDQALVNELATDYGGYSPLAIISVGLTWLAGTLLVAIVLSWLPQRKIASINEAKD